MNNYIVAFIFVVQIAWIASAVSIARTKTEDPTDRIAWLLIVLFFNILGVILYLLFGPPWQQPHLSPEEYEADVKRRANEGRL